MVTKGSGKKAKVKTSKTTVVKETPVKTTTASTTATNLAPTTTTNTAPTPTVTPAPSNDVKSSSSSDSVLTHTEIEEQFSALNEKLSQLRSLEMSIVSDMKRLQKVTTKYIKSLNKKNRKTSTGDKKKRAPSGFAKPTEITPELCQFLNVAEGTEMARTEVTKKLTSYIKEHGLQDTATNASSFPMIS